MKALIKNILFSIAISCVIFCAVCIFFDIYYGGSFKVTDYQMTKMVAGCILTGIGFGTPTILYKKENLPAAFKYIIHLVVGFSVYLVAGFFAGWIPTSLSLGKCLLIITMQLGFAFLIWLGFYWYNKKLARRMNQAIQDKR